MFNSKEIGHESYKALGYLQSSLENDQCEEVAPSLLDNAKVSVKDAIDWCNRMSENMDIENHYFVMDVCFDERDSFTIWFRSAIQKEMLCFDFRNEQINAKKYLDRNDEAAFRVLEQDILRKIYK